MASEKTLKVLFVSLGYMPTRMTSDKQFVRDLIFSLPADIQCAVWALNDWPASVTTETLGGRAVRVHAGPRWLHRPRYQTAELARGDYVYSHHPGHGAMRQLAELTSSLLARLPELAHVIWSERPDVIHATDNWGPVMRILKTVAGGIPVTCTKMSARVTRGRRGLYGAFLAACVGGCDAIICFTDACAREFARAGVPRQRLTTIRWGVSPPVRDAGLAERIERLRGRYQCRHGELLVAVSPQAFVSLRHGAQSLAQTLEELQAIASKIPLRGVVAVKPDHWTPQMADLQTDRVVVESGPDDFHDLLWAADILFSPTYARFRDRTATPPLAWLEAMARETALVTTAGHGVAETVVDGRNGILYDRTPELLTKLHRLLERGELASMKRAARETAARQHSKDTIARQHAQLWHELAGHR